MGNKNSCFKGVFALLEAFLLIFAKISVINSLYADLLCSTLCAQLLLHFAAINSLYEVFP